VSATDTVIRHPVPVESWCHLMVTRSHADVCGSVQMVPSSLLPQKINLFMLSIWPLDQFQQGSKMPTSASV